MCVCVCVVRTRADTCVPCGRAGVLRACVRACRARARVTTLVVVGNYR